MEQEKELKEYKVSSRTALWVDSIIASQNLFSIVMDAARETYGDAVENGEIGKKILDTWNKLQDVLIEHAGFSIVENIGHLDNLRKPQTEI